MTESRFERKVALSEHQFADFLCWQKNFGNLFKKAYADRIVHSVYFDTLDMDSLWGNLSGESRRSKYRLRWYGSLEPREVFLEIKSRKNLVGTKTRIELSSVDLDLKNLSSLRRCLYDALKSKDTCLTEKLIPTAYVAYDRSYYADYLGNRMTIDTNIRQKSLETKSILSKPFEASPVYAVVEFKFHPSQKPHMVTCLKQFPFMFTRNSKYVNSHFENAYLFE